MEEDGVAVDAKCDVTDFGDISGSAGIIDREYVARSNLKVGDAVRIFEPVETGAESRESRSVNLGQIYHFIRTGARLACKAEE